MFWNSDGVKTTSHAQVESVTKTEHLLPIRFNWKGGSAECKGSRTAQIAAGDQIKLLSWSEKSPFPASIFSIRNKGLRVKNIYPHPTSTLERRPGSTV